VENNRVHIMIYFKEQEDKLIKLRPS